VDSLKLPGSMTQAQAEIVNKCIASITRLEGMRDKAKEEHLPVLADFLNECKNMLEIGLKKQVDSYGHPQAGLFA
jgi:hypothetical protein